MYLDKPMRDHTLLQAICRTNRTYGDMKTHGLIVDYLGIFDDVAQALEFDEKGFQKVVSNIADAQGQAAGRRAEVPGLLPRRGPHLSGYEGLIAAQDCLPNNDDPRPFAADYSYLSKLWEAISPDPILDAVRGRLPLADARSTSRCKPSTGTGKLLWHALGAKTIELIHENVHVDAIRDDLDTLVLDADLLEAVLGAPRPEQEGQGDRDQDRAAAAQAHGRPALQGPVERLEDLKERHEQGLLNSVDFLKQLLDLAKDVLEAERETPVEDPRTAARRP